MMKSFTELSQVMGEDVEDAEVFQERVDERGDGGLLVGLSRCRGVEIHF